MTTVETLSVEAREAGITPLEALLRRGRLRATLELVERQPFDGPLFVRVDGETHVLGSMLARAMRVEAA